MEDKLIELLMSIGLGKNEIEVYLDVLKNRASTAYAIANRINQHRSGVYESLKKLMQRGFIVEFQDEKRKLYQTRESTAIEEYLNQKQTDLSELRPYLQTISNTEIPEDSVSVSYGLTRLRTMFSNLSELNQEILIWTLPKSTETTIGEWFLTEMKSKILGGKTPVKIIGSRELESIKGLDKTPLTEIKYMDEESNIFTIVCADKVFLIVLGNPVAIIEMKNEVISTGFKARFDTFWSRASSI